MASEYNDAGMTPEQKAGLAAGAALAIAGLAISLIRRKREPESPIKATADRIMENPSLKSVYGAARESLDEARGRFDPKTIEAAKQQLAKQAENLPANVRSDVEPTARELAARALDVAQRVRAGGAERSRELSKRWEKEYGPAARTIAEDARHEADEFISTARKKAGEFSDVARKDYIPKIIPMATAAGGAIASAFSERSEKLQKQLKDGELPEISAKRLGLGNGSRTSPGLVKRTGSTIADVTSQIMMIGFWGAALGTVIFYGILNEEQREKVRAFFSDTYEQVSELIEDFRDEDAFSNPGQQDQF